jgi:hypothetical protein
MLDITIDLVPFGLEPRRKNIARVKIWNDASGTFEIGNYGYRLTLDDGSKIEGEYKGFKREKGVFHLMKEILDDAL